MQKSAALYYELDPQGRIRRVSRELLSILDRCESEIGSQEESVLWSNNIPSSLLKDKKESVNLQLNWQAKIPLKDKHNKDFWVSLFMTPIIIGKQFLGYTVVCKQLDDQQITVARNTLQALEQGNATFYHGNLFSNSELVKHRLATWLANISLTNNILLVSVFMSLYLIIALLTEGSKAFLPVMLVSSLIIGAIWVIIVRKMQKPGKDSMEMVRKMADTMDFNLRMPDTQLPINTLLHNLEYYFFNAREVSTALSVGNFDNLKGYYKGELFRQQMSVNSVTENMSNTLAAINELIVKMSHGKFSVLNAQENLFDGFYKEIVDNVATVTHSIHLTITGIIQVMSLMEKGSFYLRMEDGDADGELRAMHELINRSLEGIESSLQDIANISRAQAEGDLTHLITGDYRGQLAELKNAINGSTMKLNEVVGQVSISATRLQGTSEDLTHNAHQVNDNAAHQLEKLAQVIHAISSMNQFITNNSEQTVTARNLVNYMTQEASKGAIVAKDAIAAMEKITSFSHRISDIVSVIDSIAFQTNLLALNAAVEAARAGEHGRGFAVVAGEVRSLAQKSADSAKTIKDLIHETVTAVDSGSAYVEQAANMLNAINGSVNQVNEIVENIANSSVTQTSNMSQVSHSVSEMEHFVKDSQTLFSHTLTSTQELQSQAHTLSDLVRFFKTGDKDKLLAEMTKVDESLRASEPEPDKDKFMFF